MTGRGSLGFRLLAGAALWIAAALLVSGIALATLFRAQVEREFSRRMTAHLDEMVAAVELAPDGAPRLARALSDPRFRKPYSGLYWQLSGPQGEIARSRSLWDVALALPGDPPPDGALHRHRLDGPAAQRLIAFERTVVLPDADRPVRLVVAADERSVTDVTASFAHTLAWSLSVLAAGLIAAAALQVGGGLRPLRRLQAALAAIREGRAERLEDRYPDEIQPLVDDLNTVLERNAAMVARARNQAGDLAHSLKTPLSIIANEAAALGAAGEEDLARRLGAQTELMQRRIDDHLVRARIAAPADMPGASTAVAPCLEALGRAMRQLHRARGLDIAVSSAPDHAFRGERQDLEEMVGNLADNACKWARGRVSLAATRERDRLLIHVDDDGPGITPGERAQVFARGVRLDERPAGSGLGLAIVRDLAELYGGRVALEDSPLGGLRARLDLPAAARR